MQFKSVWRNEDIVGIPKVADHRLYYKCDRDLTVDAKYPGSWNTVIVTCPNQNLTLAVVCPGPSYGCFA